MGLKQNGNDVAICASRSYVTNLYGIKTPEKTHSQKTNTVYVTNLYGIKTQQAETHMRRAGIKTESNKKSGPGFFEVRFFCVF